MNKRGRIFFVLLVVFFSMGLLLSVYVNHRNIIKNHENYLAGKIVGEALDNINTGEAYLSYIDSAARWSIAQAIQSLPSVAPDGCLTPEGVWIIKPGCMPSESEFQSRLFQEFDKAFKPYFEKGVIRGNWNTLPSAPAIPGGYEYYILKGVLYGLPYAPMSFDGKNVDYAIRPAFSVRLPHPVYAELEQAFQRGTAIEAGCEGSADYPACISAGIMDEPGWQPLSAESDEDRFLLFTKSYLDCVNSPDTDCYCTLPDVPKEMEVVSSSLSGEMKFSLPSGMAVNPGTPGWKCVLGYSTLSMFERMKLQAQSSGNVRLYSWESGKYIGPQTLYPPLIMIKFMWDGQPFESYEPKVPVACLLDGGISVFEHQLLKEPILCAVPQTVYARVTTSYSSLVYNQTTMQLDFVPFQFLVAVG